MAGTYVVALKSEGEPLPESNRVHLVVGFKQERVSLSWSPRRRDTLEARSEFARSSTGAQRAFVVWRNKVVGPF